ncbi:uncharacterized protein LOC101889681 [Musca domestica]|uniref:Uncharacterized protein LOC101889681 n=1 Tax=Musca domestica TaxID=7370 RepID=A0A1I8N6V0_MUSDO|nr:uncharacterized protein LOC101889681 [Musca domestica]
MNIFIPIIISFLLIFKSLQGLPTSDTNEVDTSNDSSHYAFLLSEAKQYSEQIEQLIRKSLPQLPSDDTFNLYRNKFNKYLELKKDYKAATAEDCEEKSLEFFDAQNAFISVYMYGHSNSTGLQDVVKILNDNGMKQIKDEFDAKRASGVYGKPDRKDFEKYVATHC